MKLVGSKVEERTKGMVAAGGMVEVVAATAPAAAVVAL